MGDKLRKLIRLVVILVGVGILVYPSISEYLSEKNSSRAVASYDDSVKELEEARINALLDEASNYNKALASSSSGWNPKTDEHSEILSLENYKKILNIKSNGMIGYISIPKLNETIRIFHGTEEAVLQVGIGHLENTSFPVGGETTHAVLSGHRGLPTASLFTDLDRLQTGDIFYIKILNKTFCYSVDKISVVLPNEIEELSIQKGRDYVTLVTCTPYSVNSHRLLVRGTRVPYSEDEPIPVYEPTIQRSLWALLSPQYRHMLIGAAAVLVFLLLRWIIIIIKRKLAKRRLPEK